MTTAEDDPQLDNETVDAPPKSLTERDWLEVVYAPQARLIAIMAFAGLGGVLTLFDAYRRTALPATSLLHQFGIVGLASLGAVCGAMALAFLWGAALRLNNAQAPEPGKEESGR